jgi:polar amino acid transport system permease protein
MEAYIIVKYIPSFLKAALETLKIALLSGLFALGIGLVLSALYHTKIKVCVIIINVYTTVMRSTPLLVQLYFLYYGLPFLGIQVNPFSCAVLSFSLNAGAYVVEILRGGLEGIDTGQFHAAYSLGMSWGECLKTIIFPQVLQRVVSPLLSQMSYLIKDTSLAAVLVVRELTYTYRSIASDTYRSLEALITPMIIYYVLYTIFRLSSGAVGRKKVEAK